MSVTLWCGDCIEYMRTIKVGSVDWVITDPPYPNNSEIFIDGVEIAIQFMKEFYCINWLVFWEEDNQPPLKIKLSSKHHWIKTNGWQARNKEAIYEFSTSNSLPKNYYYPNVNTGIDAPRKDKIGNHPTAKPIRLMKKLIVEKTQPGNIIFDPFMGSGTTGLACVQLGRSFIGCEINPAYFAIAEKRIHQAQSQLPLFPQESFL